MLLTYQLYLKPLSRSQLHVRYVRGAARGLPLNFRKWGARGKAIQREKARQLEIYIFPTLKSTPPTIDPEDARGGVKTRQASQPSTGETGCRHLPRNLYPSGNTLIFLVFIHRMLTA
jgi:hypothetical protein